MKTCPYCKKTIEDHWLYCRNCNKPLIVNLEDSFNHFDKFPYDGVNPDHGEFEEEDEFYDGTIIEDKEIERKITSINELLEKKEILGEAIPGSLLLEKSSLYYKKRDLPNAEKNLELALKNFKEDNDVVNMAICYNELGLIYEESGFFDQAIYHFNRSLDIFREINDNHKVIMILNNLGNVYYLIQDLEHSYKFYQEALQISKEENYIYEEVKSASNLVEVLYLLNDHDRIKKILARNEDFFKENEDIYGAAQTQLKYGKLYYLQGFDFDLAFQHLTNALKLINKIKKTVSIYIQAKLEWECFLYLGKVHLLWENLIEAEALLLQSLESVRIFGFKDNINEGIILEEIARLYSIKDDVKRAIEYYDLSYEIFHKYGDNIKCADVKYKIAQLYSISEQYESEAINYFEDALNLYESLGHTREVAILLHKLGDYYLHKGMIALAVPNFERARDYFKDLQDDYSMNLLDEKIKSLIKNP